MATIINNPSGTTDEDSSGMGIVVGLIVAVVLVILFFLFAWPSINNTPGVPNTGTDTTQPGASANVNVTLPSGTTNSTPSGGTSNTSAY